MTYPKFSATFFDLDGTLVDTGPPHREAERATIQAFGFDDLAADHPVTFGHGVVPGSQMVADHYGLNDPEAVLTEYLRQWKRIAAAGIDLLPGAESTVRAIAASGIKVALVTSGERPYVDGFIKMSALGDVFSLSVSSDDVTNMKPHPEPYIKAAELLNVPPSACVVFEDSVAGFQSAKSAGMVCIGVGEVALSAEGNDAPDMAITSFIGFDISSVRPY
ncbi:MAG: HAD family phosphatase [Chloroflexi bacterium]|jgi:mannitol-1-/sugar-/sorbitol-6-phosphatase|nr:HAD family phosphatase [Chloroflexota bacterium]